MCMKVKWVMKQEQIWWALMDEIKLKWIVRSICCKYTRLVWWSEAELALIKALRELRWCSALLFPCLAHFFERWAFATYRKKIVKMLLETKMFQKDNIYPLPFLIVRLFWFCFVFYFHLFISVYICISDLTYLNIQK